MISNKIVEKNKGILQCKSGGLAGFCIIHLTMGLNYLWGQIDLIFKHLLPTHSFLEVCILKISDVNTDDRKKNSATSEDNSSHRATSYVDVRNVWFSNEAGGKKW